LQIAIYYEFIRPGMDNICHKTIKVLDEFNIDSYIYIGFKTSINLKLNDMDYKTFKQRNSEDDLLTAIRVLEDLVSWYKELQPTATISIATLKRAIDEIPESYEDF